jgi:hypothetical protein
MSLPRAVLEAEEKANRAIEELLNPQLNPEPKPTTNEPPLVESVAALEPPATPNDSTPQPVSGTDETVEHRYKVLQGKYNSEVPRLSAENKDLKSRLQNIEHQLDVMKNTKPLEPLVNQDEIEQYGEGLIDVARRIAREELSGKQAEIDALKNRIDSISNVTAEKVESDFFTSLTGMVPEWEQINTEANFLSWLNEFDELTGETRQSLLSRAEKSRDAARTAKFFNAFKKTSSSWAATSNQALESQVVPPTNRAPNTPPAKKIWTRGDVGEFYARVRRGEIQDADAVAIEADIMAAQIEGRIR